MLRKIKVYLKLSTVLLIVAIFLLSTSVVNFFAGDEKKRKSVCITITSFLSKIVLMALGVKVKTDKKIARLTGKDNFLVVSNHLSYLDTLIISSKIRSVFIASADGHQQQFPIGLITRNSGGIFVERKSRRKVKKDLQKIKNALELGFNVVLFPEGTTSDGTGVLPFKTPFFFASHVAGIKILPVCVNYKNINGSPVTLSNKNMVFFYEKISFVKHFMGLLEVKNIEVSLEAENMVDSGDFHSRKELSDCVYKKITTLYEPKP